MPFSQSEDISKAVTKFLQDNFPLVGRDSLPGDEKLLEGGAVDSLGLLLIIDFLETTFGIAVRDVDVLTENFETVNAITDFVRNKLLATR